MCSHLAKFARPRPEPVTPGSRGCEECLAQGGEWVHLRLCLTCGHVGCCDDSPNHHATRHFHATKHPVIKSFEPGEDWGWCYLHEEMIEAVLAFPAESPPQHYASPDEAR
jgi:thioredoxin reductase (NADPH)